MTNLKLPLARLGRRDVQRRFALHLGAKIVGAAFAVLAVKAIGAYLFTPAFAEGTPPEPPPFISPINTMWTLFAAFLVFFMQAGFMVLEAGFARTRETVNVLLEGIVDTCLCGILFCAWGFAFMFGAGNGFIGHAVLLPAEGARTPTGRTGVADPGVLALPVRLRRHLQHDHLGRHGRPHRLRRATCSTASASAASSTRSSATGPGVRTAGSTRSSRRRSTTSPARRSSTPSAASSPSRAPSPSGRASDASSSATAAGHARPRHDHRRRRRRHPLVRLVRVQPGQHALGHGRRRASAASRPTRPSPPAPAASRRSSSSTRATRSGTAA